MEEVLRQQSSLSYQLALGILTCRQVEPLQNYRATPSGRTIASCLLVAQPKVEFELLT